MLRPNGCILKLTISSIQPLGTKVKKEWRINWLFGLDKRINFGGDKLCTGINRSNIKQELL